MDISLLSPQALMMTPHESSLLHQARPVVPMEPPLPGAMHLGEDTALSEASRGGIEESVVVLDMTVSPWMSVTTVLQCSVAFSLTAAIVFTNVLVLMVRFRDRRLRKQVSSFFITSLAVSDLCVGLFQSVPGILGVLHGGGWDKDELGYWWIKLSVYGTSTASAVSMYSVMAISLDRYIAITRPLRYWSIIGNKKYALRYTIIGAWLAAAVVMLPILSPVIPAYYSATTFAAVLDYARCVPFTAAVGYVVYAPCTLTLLIVYAVVVKVSHRHVQQIAQDRRRCSLATQPQESVARRTKYLRNSVFIVATFLVTWLPRGAYIIYEIIAGGPVAGPDFLTLWLTLSNNFTHAMIYNWFHKDFRTALRETFHFCPFYGKKQSYEQLIYSIHVMPTPMQV